MIAPTSEPPRKSSLAWAWILGGAIIIAACILALTHRTPSSSASTAAAKHPASPAGASSAPAASPVPSTDPLAPPADQANKATEARARLAPAGTFYMVDYAAAKTPKGVVGFEPGRAVKFVEAHREQGTLTVTDGQYQADVRPEQLTNDLDIAELARDRDADSQRKLAEHQTAEMRAYQAIEKKTNADYSKDVDRNNTELKASSKVGATPGENPLNAAPSPTSTVVAAPGVVYGSPYSYFAPNAVNAVPVSHPVVP